MTDPKHNANANKSPFDDLLKDFRRSKQVLSCSVPDVLKEHQRRRALFPDRAILEQHGRRPSAPSSPPLDVLTNRVSRLERQFSNLVAQTMADTQDGTQLTDLQAQIVKKDRQIAEQARQIEKLEDELALHDLDI